MKRARVFTMCEMSEDDNDYAVTVHGDFILSG